MVFIVLEQFFKGFFVGLRISLEGGPAFQILHSHLVFVKEENFLDGWHLEEVF